MSIIKLDHVTKRYRRSHLGKLTETTGVADLSLEVKSGEVFGLIGLNGSGKTTTIKLILGLHFATTGTVQVTGKIMPDLDVLSRVGYLPEGAYVNKYLTGGEAVMLFAKLSRIPSSGRKTAVDRILEQVGMTRAAGKRISEYSKGMLQRISLAQALVHDPDILVLDEPITGLDPLAIREMRQMISWMKSRGKTVFFSSHDISEVEKVCDRIGILANGRLAATIDHSEWNKKPGQLEEIFASTVSRSEDVGMIKFS